MVGRDRRGRRLRRVLVGVLAALAVVVATLGVLATSGSGASDQFVKRAGTTLRIGGEPFRFVGLNLYDAAATDSFSCEPASRLDDAGLDAAMRTVQDAGGTVVRFWAFQSYTRGGTDFSGIDRVLAAARAHGLRVLPVLEDGPGNCSTGAPRTWLDGTWYVRGYRQPLGSATLSYREYAARVARHYRDEPAIIAWSLMNEAETSQRDADGRSPLVDFARDMAAVVHRADPRHLVTLGTQGNGAPGASGSDFAAIYSLPGLDLTEVHDWHAYSQAMPGTRRGQPLPRLADCQATDAPLACSFVIARALGKPIVVGEAGVPAADAGERVARAAVFRRKISAAFSAGASGYLLWHLNVVNTDGFGVRIGSRDPVLAVLRDASRALRRGRLPT